MLTEAKTTLGRERRVSPAQPGLSSLFLLLCRFNKAPKKCQAPCQAPGNGSQVGHKTVTDCDTHTHTVVEIVTVNLRHSQCCDTHSWGFCRDLLVSGAQAGGGVRTGLAGEFLLKEVTTI